MANQEQVQKEEPLQAKQQSLSNEPKDAEKQKRQTKRPRKNSFTMDELDLLNVICHPLYIFDVHRPGIPWANEAGLELWNADSLEELVNRNFDVMSEASKLRLNNFLNRVTKGEIVHDVWTVYPKGQPKTLHLTFSDIKIGDDPISKLFIECVDHIKDELDQESLRGVEMLRHLPMAVCQFDMEGNIMYQNPEAITTFGRGDEPTAQQEPHEQNQEQQRQQQQSKTDSRSQSPTSPDGSPEIDTNPEGSKIQDERIPKDDRPETHEKEVQSKKKNDQHPKQRKRGQRNNSISKNNEDSRDSAKDEKGEDNPKTSHSQFLRRFVDQKVGTKLWEQITNGNDYCVEAVQAQQHTQKGNRWSDIKVRRSTDPVTAKPVILYSARDITDIMQAQKDKEANAKKGEFFAIMAHEIRTPLHQVTGFIDLLNLTKLDEEQKSFVGLLKTSATSLFTVINDVLDYSKLEAAKMKFEQIPFEPKAVVQGSLEAVRLSAEDKGLYLKSNWENDIPFRILGDPNRLRQILLNLLGNAVKFTSGGGIEICVTTEPAKTVEKSKSNKDGDNSTTSSEPCSMLRFSVSDTGIGIGPEQQQRIFVKYQQADSSVARNYGGTGLGLSICKGLAENMGGSIGVNSELGKGSSFWFTIPIKLPPEQDVVRTDENQGDRFSVDEDACRLSVLVAEDNKVNQKLVVNMLKRMGHTATVVENGKLAVDHLAEKTSIYDVVLMDIQMPVMDGIEATRRLRTQGWTELPVIGLTASQHRTDYTELGFNDWIGKPVPIRVLKKKLDRIRAIKRHTTLQQPKSLIQQ